MGIVTAGLGLLAACDILSGQSKGSDRSFIGVGTGGTGAGGNTPVGCDPTMLTTAVADTCGVFVSPTGNDGNTGTSKATPVKTLTVAVTKGSTIYACAGAMPFDETLAPDKSVTLFGGLDCTTWIYSSGTKTQLTAAAGAIPLKLTSAATVHDFAITAADATAAGGSSIAVLDDQADLTLENVDIAAGAGMDGTAGATQMQVTTLPIANGTNGNAPTGCSTVSVTDGAGGTNMCSGTPTNGGSGGNGIAGSVGEPGGSGQPMTPANGGAGQTTTPCQPGGTGNEATAGAAATGSPGTGASGIGDISASGYQAPTAIVGGPGTPGQGGGGGGAAHSCDVNDMFAGPSGGGGGAGGCGGAPGNPGTSGGSSIGILVLNATLTLDTVNIMAKGGGAGGNGGGGQSGGNGGLPGGSGGSGACPGGLGGQGGAGGPGAGGAGGHSVGIAFKGGTPPTVNGSIVISPGAGGPSGVGADGMTQTQGAAGLRCTTLDFATSACSM
jgi:hypothetical protein